MNKKYSLEKQGMVFLSWNEKVPVAKIPKGVAKEGAGEKRIPFAHLANSVPVYLTFAELLKKSDKQDGRVLDIGCGTGRSITFVKDYVNKSGFKYNAIDYSKACIDYAKAQYSRYGVIFKQHNGSDLPFEANKFDYIISSHVLEHIPKGGEIKYFSEISRILKKGGIAIIGTPNRKFNQDLFHKNPEDKIEYRLVVPHQHEYLLKELKGLLSSNKWFSVFEINQTINKINRKLMIDSIDKIKPKNGIINVLKFKLYQELRKNSRLQDIMARLGTEYLLRKMKVNYIDLIKENYCIKGSKLDNGDDFIIVATK
jgi:ubiquinone/menaquinone biosynthesis C-methylase UbiE